jgi:hypothetical protein
MAILVDPPLGPPLLQAAAAVSEPQPKGPASPAIVPLSSLERDPLKLNFKNFMWKTWRTLFDNDPTPIMYEVGDRLQHGPDKDIVMGYRGLSKSYITVDFGVWALYCDPTEIVLTVSGSGDGAKGNAALAYSMINGFDWLAHMKPSGSLRQSAQAFDVKGSRMEKSESFAAMSLFGQLTGRRCSLAIPDDVETPNTSETEADRALLRTRYAEIGGSLLKPGGRIKVLGTAQTEQTHYLHLAQEKGYGMMMWPVVFPTAKELPKYGPWLAPSIRTAVEANPELAGTSVEPSRFDEEDLFGPQGRRLEYGTTEFDRQFRLFLDAGVSNNKPLRLRDIPVLEIAEPTPTAPLKVPCSVTWSPSPTNQWQDLPVDALNGDSAVYAPMGVDHDRSLWQEPEQKVLVVDPSGGGKDETSWGVLAQHLGLVFLCRSEARLEGFSADTMRAIAEDAKLYRVHKVIIEKNYGGGMFGELLLPHLINVGHPCTIEELNAGQVQKEVRIVDSLQGLVTDHRLVVAAEVLRRDWRVHYDDVDNAKQRFYRLTYQLTRITKQKGALAHDDRVDMLASGVASFLGTLKRQLEAARKDNLDAFIQEQAEKIIALRKAQGLGLLNGSSATPSSGRTRIGDFMGNLVEGMSGSPYFRNRTSKQ